MSSARVPASYRWDQPDWFVNAACKFEDPHIYDDNDFSVYPPREVKCASCPVRRECLKYALENKYEGIYGGTTTKFRKRISAARNRKYCPDYRCKSPNVNVVGKHGVCTRCGLSWNHGTTAVEHEEIVELSKIDQSEEIAASA